MVALPQYPEVAMQMHRAAQERRARMNPQAQRAPFGLKAVMPANPIAAATAPAPAPARAAAKLASPQDELGLSSRIAPENTFDRFVEGSCNQLAVALAREICRGSPEAKRVSPMTIVAAPGRGKTHLLHAIAHEVQKGEGRALYTTAETFMYRIVPELKLARRAVLDVHVLLMDDIQFLNGQRVVEEFGHALHAMSNEGRMIVAASDRAPAELDHLDARLRSRLGAGLPVFLGEPDCTTRFALLERIGAESQGVPADVIEFIAKNVTVSQKALIAAVNWLILESSLTGKAVDILMAERALRDFTSIAKVPPKVEEIQRVVARHFNISREDMVSARRTRVIVRPRQIAMFVAKMHTPRSLPEIGRRFGGRDHTTVLHACKIIKDLVQRDRQVSEDVETIRRLLGVA